MFRKIKSLFELLLGKKVGFVSEADTFLAQCRKNDPKPSASQAKEITEYAKIDALRDGKPSTETKTKLWREF